MTCLVTILVWGRQSGRPLGASRGLARRRGDLGGEHGPVDGAEWHAEGLGDAVDVGQPSAGWQSDDDGAYLAHVRGAPIVQGRGEAGVEQGGGEAARGVDGRLQRGGAVAVGEVGGIEPVGEGESARVVASGGELPVDALGGLLAGGVVVGGHEDAGTVEADVGGEQVRLPVGEGGAEGGDADGLPGTGQGEGNRI